MDEPHRRQRVMHFVKAQGEVTISQVVENVDVDRSFARHVLQAASNEGRVIRQNSGAYQTLAALQTSSGSAETDESDGLSPTERVKEQYVAGEIGDHRLDEQMERAVVTEFDTPESVEDGFDRDTESILDLS